MCLQTTTSYSNCRAVRVHLDVCASHIEHTRRQLDNAPCPKFSKTHQHVTNTTRCFCKDSASLGRHAGSTVGVGCARMASRGYGENGLTWGFEKGPSLGLKKKKDRAREKAIEKEKEVEVKMEDDSDDVSKSWADINAASCFGDASGSGASHGTAEEGIRNNQMMMESNHQQSKKVKFENSPSSHAQFPPLEPLKTRDFDVDHEMN
ncbi:hypothetical protein ONS95_003802 [Cadophora gregata]|uniref:uncharacterized protein n=1 Tax=Cadophora gregata TaxID=51156 RepID=UPI0026DCEE37|nr:uncharacterized protein ONS95_003802 [Cadophora gregata]KAK0107095.1 hypothetical protein ONS95_003802 [Cadophora gregata]KAK0116780.1 hypothetical protein ONS96_012630 [Cadophora gregata f. sp. sojae]